MCRASLSCKKKESMLIVLRMRFKLTCNAHGCHDTCVNTELPLPFPALPAAGASFSCSFNIQWNLQNYNTLQNRKEKTNAREPLLRICKLLRLLAVPELPAAAELA